MIEVIGSPEKDKFQQTKGSEWEAHNLVAIFRNPLLLWLTESTARYDDEEGKFVVDLVADPVKVHIGNTDELDWIGRCAVKRFKCIEDIKRIVEMQSQKSKDNADLLAITVFNVSFVGEPEGKLEEPKIDYRYSTDDDSQSQPVLSGLGTAALGA